jgi:methylmalonyl-CoA mutase, N-terminal domain
VVVGVNRFQEAGERPVELGQPDFRSLEAAQRRKLADLRAARDEGEIRARLDGLREAARGTENLMPRLIEAVKARVTLGEISDAFREAWGVYRPR